MKNKNEPGMTRRQVLYMIGSLGIGLLLGRKLPFGSSDTVINQVIDNSDNYTNVKAFGAKGDGETDDYGAIMEAVHAAANGNRAVYFPKGRYKCSKTIELPSIERPNTAGTSGAGFKMIGAGMYDSGLIYTGSDYAIHSSHDLAEAVHFIDFYINHARGGGIRLPQGAHQMFERFFSSACGAGKYGILIEGNKSKSKKGKGYGAYMLSLSNCRFWSEQGYMGTGVRIEDVLLCARIESCFFSTLKADRSHLEVVRSYGVQIMNSAFERLENPDAMQPLIRLEGSHSISIMECHAEAAYESFVGIYDHSSNVVIDGCRLDHYAIMPYNHQHGYIVSVDDDSSESRKIQVGGRNYSIQSNHPDTVHGSIIYDRIGCVSVEGYEDSTPFHKAWERRTVPLMGNSGQNLLVNPALYSDHPEGVPHNVEPIASEFVFEQLAPSGCKIAVQGDGTSVLRFTALESMNKYPYYTFFLVGSNKTGQLIPMRMKIGNLELERSMIWPSGKENFTQYVTFAGADTATIDILVDLPYELDVYGMYLVPNITTQVPYGSETIVASKLHVGREISFGEFSPSAEGAVGDMVLNSNPVPGGNTGWVYTSSGWKPFGTIENN